jgi:hypothetical protein
LTKWSGIDTRRLHAAFSKVIEEIVAFFMVGIAKCGSVDDGVGESNPLGIVSALNWQYVCPQKAAMSMTESEPFSCQLLIPLLPMN